MTKTLEFGIMRGLLCPHQAGRDWRFSARFWMISRRKPSWQHVPSDSPSLHVPSPQTGLTVTPSPAQPAPSTSANAAHRVHASFRIETSRP